MFTYLLIMLFFGGLMLITMFIGGGDHDVSHEVHLEHDVGHDAGYSTPQGTVHSSGLLQGWLSVKVIAAFGTAFGAAGLVAMANKVPHGWSLLIAIGSGIVLAFLIRMLIGIFRRSECNSSFSRAQLVGKTGTVTLGILEGKIGEAQFSFNGESVSVPVKSEDGKEISQGTQVTGTAYGAIMIVKRTPPLVSVMQ